MLILCPYIKLDFLFEKQVIFSYLYIYINVLIYYVYTCEVYKFKLGKIYLVKYPLTIFSFQNHMSKTQYQLFSVKQGSVFKRTLGLIHMPHLAFKITKTLLYIKLFFKSGKKMPP